MTVVQRPVIVLVDDQPRGLSALLDAMARRYGADYRVTAHLSAAQALEELARARRDGEQLALVIADQWMPEMTGRELLLRVHDRFPEAQRALLVGWGDKRANDEILQGCALGQLDNYILKPWSPPEIHLYPIVSEFLAAFAQSHGPKLELVRVVGVDPSPRLAELRELLERHAIPHGCYALDSEPGRKLVEQARIDVHRLPAVVLLDGRVLHDPSNAELADLLGTSTVDGRACDLAIVGAGPAGLGAAVSAASEGLRTVVIEHQAIGGQAGTSSLIRNFLGFPRGIPGAELAKRAYQQAWLFGARYALARRAVGLRAEGERRIVVLDDGREIAARAVIVATGAEYRRLGIARVDRFEGIGVWYIAGADIATALAGHDVVVAGGGNSAGQAVVHLAKTARRVVLVVRGDSLADSMSAYLIAEIRRLRNVDLRFATEIVDADGVRGLEQVMLRQRTGRREIVATTALFVMIGARPHTDWLAGVVERDRSGFVVTGAELAPAARRGFDDRDPLLLETSLPGVFAAGDVRAGSTKRLASAVGEGAIAVQVIFEYLRRGASAEPVREVPHDDLQPSPDLR